MGERDMQLVIAKWVERFTFNRLERTCFKKIGIPCLFLKYQSKLKNSYFIYLGFKVLSNTAEELVFQPN